MDTPRLTRRNALKGIAGLGGAAVLGGFAINGGAASNVTISADNFTEENDTGDLDAVWLAPEMEVNWENFDEPVGKVRLLVEAGREGQTYDDDLPGGPYDYVPVFRATPYIDGETWVEEQEADESPTPITTGHFANVVPWPIKLFKEEWERRGYNRTEDTSVLTHWDGTSVGDNAGAYFNGMYDPVGETAPFEEEIDGATETTQVNLRFTISLHAMEPTSPLVMYDEEQYGAPFQYPDFYDAGGDVPANAIPHVVLQDNDQHPAINVVETSFDVNVHNEPAQQNFGGDSNPDGYGDDVATPTPEPSPTPTPTQTATGTPPE